MTPAAFLEQVRLRATGRPVSHKKLAANSLLIYVDGQPGDPTGFVFWFEPTWNVRGPERVLTGSRQAQDVAGLQAASEALCALLGCMVEAVEVEPVTFSLVMRPAGGYEVRTFVSHPEDDLAWHIDVRVTGQSLEGCPGGMELLPPVVGSQADG